MIDKLHAESQAVIDAQGDLIDEAYQLHLASGRSASPADEPAEGETQEMPTDGAGIETPPGIEEPEESEVESFTAEDLVAAAEDIDLEDDPLPSGFVVAFTTSKIRRLHFMGNCGRRPGEHYRSYKVFGDEAPEASKYDKRCRQCFPEYSKIGELEQEPREESDSSGSSTCSSQ